MDILYFILTLIGLGVGIGVGYKIRQVLARKQANSIEAKLKEKIEEVKAEANKILNEAKTKSQQLIDQSLEENSRHKKQLIELENKLIKREELLDKRNDEVEANATKLEANLAKVQEVKTSIEELQKKEEAKLEAVAGLNKEEAKTALFDAVQKNYETDLAASFKKLERDREEELNTKAAGIIATVLQRYARSGVSEVTTSSVSIPSEDIKGKIIGREGRNIRHFEQMSGVDVIVDETPDSITISSFDPVRRALAKLALEKLIADGRIQPAKIEEKILEAKEEINEQIKKAGEDACYEVGIVGLPKEIVHLLGRLNYRTSYGQNVLTHSIEVAILAGMMASELGGNVELAKTAGLLHDIGKSVDHELEGAHLELGVKILQKYGVSQDIINAMKSHHEDYPVEILEANFVNAADALSAARPGARRENIENYLKRLANLEKIATDFKGVEKAYAIQAGRELRVFVTPTQIDDFSALKMAREIADKIESEIHYPGEVKVTVIRETRAVEFAK
ncbi:MAG TPA: ribonuclease Y [Candidatus Paceibacterota bacterium]|nr:ribonuclease Y [Candidatus Paceibacterota bacterium]